MYRAQAQAAFLSIRIFYLQVPVARHLSTHHRQKYMRFGNKAHARGRCAVVIIMRHGK
jgi:hypothetical protein